MDGSPSMSDLLRSRRRQNSEHRRPYQLFRPIIDDDDEHSDQGTASERYSSRTRRSLFSYDRHSSPEVEAQAPMPYQLQPLHTDQMLALSPEPTHKSHVPQEVSPPSPLFLPESPQMSEAALATTSLSPRPSSMLEDSGAEESSVIEFEGLSKEDGESVIEIEYSSEDEEERSQFPAPPTVQDESDV